MAAAERAGFVMGGRIFSVLLPFLCGMGAVLVSNIPITLFGGLVPAPLLGLIPVYFWCLVRPDLMTPAATLVIGIFEDIMAGGPPGVWTLSFVLTYAVVARQRDSFAGLSGAGAPVAGFATAAFITCLVAYVVVALYYWRLPLLGPMVGELAVTVLFYIPGRLCGGRHSSPVGRTASSGFLGSQFLMPVFDKKDKSRYATFTRRSVGMGVGMTAVFAVLAGRLYELQIRDGAEYATEADDNRISGRVLAPPRGRILDRFGVEMANNKRNFRVLLVSEQATEGVSEAINTLAKVIEISDTQKKRILHDVAQRQEIRAGAGGRESVLGGIYSRINLHLPYLPGIQPDVGEIRDYPLRRRVGAYPGLRRPRLAGRQERRRGRAARSAGLSHRQTRH